MIRLTERLDELPFEHICRNGTIFKGTKCNLKDGVTVEYMRKLTDEEKMQDAIEFGAWHRCQIWGDLKNGFQGYDCVKVTLP